MSAVAVFDLNLCEVEGCGRSLVAAGLCSMHYSRRWRKGDDADMSADSTKGLPPKSFRGRGRVKCYLCGDPVRDHPVGPICDRPAEQQIEHAREMAEKLTKARRARRR